VRRKIWLAVLLSLLLGIIVFSWWFRAKVYLPAVSQTVNILILGKGGIGHEAPDLTDTVMLVSFPVDGPIKLVSLPRDIWVADNRAKLNASYYWGKEKGVGGLVMVKRDVTKITGVPVNFALVVDFSAFEKVIEVLGGVEVEVKNAFTDTKYPIAGKENDLCQGDRTYQCRYETVSFEQGLTQMNGELALKFVRSRNAEGDEGTDLARGQRQTQVIKAIKDKLLSKNVVLHPSIWKKLWEVARDNIETDLNSHQIFNLGLKIIHLRARIVSLAIPDGWLVNPPILAKYDRQYVFVPADGSGFKLQQWFKNESFY